MDDDTDLTAELTRYLAEQRAEAAAVARTREHWLRQMAAEDGTFDGMLVDLAEQGRAVVVRSCTGRSHRGAIRAVGTDFCIVAGSHGQVLVARAAIDAVRVEPGGDRPTPLGDRTVELEADLVTAIAGLAGERRRVQVVTVGGESLAGELRTVNLDSLSVRLDGDGAVAVVPAGSVAEVGLR